MQSPVDRWLDQVVDELPLPLQSAVRESWLAISQLSDTQPIIDRLYQSDSGQTILASLPRVLAGSDFVSRSLVTRHDLFVTLVGEDSILKPRSPEQLAHVCRALHPYASDVARISSTLRKLRQTELVRIAWRDLAGWAPLEEVVETLSALADNALLAALACAHYQVVKQHGHAVGENSGLAISLVVLALGKLGGRELNFSSDIDLVLAYEEAGETLGPKKITNHEFFVKVGQQLVSLLQTLTDDGFVFRVDLRLRPNGASGPLALSFDAMDHYYTTHGRDWERYALIKMRLLSHSNVNVRGLLGIVRPFVYRKYLDFGAFDAIRDMKRLIEKELHAEDQLSDLKRGRGGIREIEFIVQSYQLIRGGREPKLQTNRLWQALEVLVSLRIMTATESEILCAAYHFLRRAEHRLQMIDDQQTHRLPVDEYSRLRLAAAMGYPDWHDFHSELVVHTTNVHRHFEQVFAPETDTDSEHSELTDLWLGRLTDPIAERHLEGLGYSEPTRLLTLCESLRRSGFYSAFSTSGRARMDRLMPLAIKACAHYRSSAAVFARLVGVIESIGRRAAYLSLLAENPLALSQLVKLISRSPWIAHWIGRHPVILDELLNPIGDAVNSDRNIIASALKQRLTTATPDDLERTMDLLREFRQAQTLQIAAADCADMLTFDAVSAALTSLAEATLEQCLVVAEQSLGSRVQLDGVDLGIVAYGKLGSQEFGYNSDLDIVFLYQLRTHSEHLTASDQAAYYCGRLIQRLIHVLTTRTAAGYVYHTDLQLRPSGRAGTMVSSLSAFESYQLANAWTWEHQALVRARLVVGPSTLAELFEAARHRILCQPRDPAELRSAVTSMRDRIIHARSTSTGDAFDFKLDRGGLVDIEFIVQLLVLRWADAFPQLTGLRRTGSILEALVQEHLLEQNLGHALMEIVARYLETDNQLKLQEKPSLVDWSTLEHERNIVTDAWHRIVVEGQ